MPISQNHRDRISTLHAEYLRLRKGKESLLILLDEAEIPEWVYHSNAIENSTLTLDETERILQDLTNPRKIHIREVYEARNLSKVMTYMREKAKYSEMNLDLLLFLHQILLSWVSDDFAGRLRKPGEYVRVGSRIAPPPEKLESLLQTMFDQYVMSHDAYILEKVARMHLEFEHIHPFCDGNGRIGRVLVNFQLLTLGFPMMMFRFRDRSTYYEAFRLYDQKKDTSLMDELIALSIIESFHKRNAYLAGQEIIALSDSARRTGVSLTALANKAKRQTIPAFRERGVWKIGIS